MDSEQSRRLPTAAHKYKRCDVLNSFTPTHTYTNSYTWHSVKCMILKSSGDWLWTCVCRKKIEYYSASVLYAAPCYRRTVLGCTEFPASQCNSATSIHFCMPVQIRGQNSCLAAAKVRERSRQLINKEFGFA